MKQEEQNKQKEQGNVLDNETHASQESNADDLTQKEKDSLAAYHKSQAIADTITDMYNDDADLTPACVMMAFGFFIARLERGCKKEHQCEVFEKALSVIGKGYTLDKTLAREVSEGKSEEEKG